MAAALSTAALVLPLTTIPPAFSAAAARPPSGAGLSSGLSSAGLSRLSSALSSARADIPCPRPPKVRRPADVPPAPVPPPDDPVLRAVGGDALATDGLTVPPGSPAPPAVAATTWLVADLDTGEVLGGCGPHVHQTPASVQKLLLAATAMPKLNPKAPMRVVPADLAIEPGSSAVGLVNGGAYTVATLWLGLILNSGNDAANALARLAGGKGGAPATVAAMNAEAKRLGAFQTHAVTPSGLDGKGQFTSAYDMALIARACFDRPDFVSYALTRNARLPAQKALKTGGFQFQNENRLIFTYRGALGGKTGFTKLARHSYVGAAERNNRRLVVTLLGAEATPVRGWQQGAALLDWGFKLPKDASVGKLVDPEPASPSSTENATPSAAAPLAAAPAAAAPAAAAAAAPAAAGPLAGAPPAGANPQPAAATRKAPPQPLTFAAAAAIAVVLAATPLLLVIPRRRHRARRRPRAQHHP